MKNKFSIGKNSENDILVNSENCLEFHAIIEYKRGRWLYHNLEKWHQTFINEKQVTEQVELKKYDIISIGNKKIYWCNYLIEGSNQKLILKDFITFNGRVNKLNFRALALLAIGLGVIIFFSPGLIFFQKKCPDFHMNKKWS